MIITFNDGNLIFPNHGNVYELQLTQLIKYFAIK